MDRISYGDQRSSTPSVNRVTLRARRLCSPLATYYCKLFVKCLQWSLLPLPPPVDFFVRLPLAICVDDDDDDT